MTEQQVRIFTSRDGQAQLEVALDRETVWLSQAQMAELFGTRRPAITKHLSNIYRSGELSEESTCSILEHMAEHGQRYRTKRYNLDAIISVGYRVNSSRATQFRQWATQVLKDHLVQGYTLNQRRLAERGIEFEQVVDLLSRTLTNQGLVSRKGEAVARVISDYARSWSLLQGYDEQQLAEVGIRQPDMQPLELDEAFDAIGELKQALIAKSEATELFGQLRGDGLASALATIEQGFGDELFYPNVASRAAHLLYFVIKNHPLADGNKRCGSFLFLWYLRRNAALLARPVEQLINDNTLVALALLVAESLPDQKTLMIRLIEHFILLREPVKESPDSPPRERGAQKVLGAGHQPHRVEAGVGGLHAEEAAAGIGGGVLGQGVTWLPDHRGVAALAGDTQAALPIVQGELGVAVVDAVHGAAYPELALLFALGEAGQLVQVAGADQPLEAAGSGVGYRQVAVQGAADLHRGLAHVFGDQLHVQTSGVGLDHHPR